MKALVGSWDNRPYRLLAENTALRTRVAEQRQELAELREENVALRAALADELRAAIDLRVAQADDVEVALTR